MAIIIDLFNETIEGTDNADIIISLLGDDYIFAGDGDDLVLAGSGDDVIDGGNGDDILLGMTGNDILIGGAGNDLLIGGGGSDTFAFNQTTGATGNDIIADFQVGLDVLDLTGTHVHASDLTDGSVFSHDATNNTLTINFGDGNSVVLAGIDAAEFAAIADSIIFDPGCVEITATAAAEVFALPVDGCVTVTGFELGETNADTIDLSAFGIDAESLSALQKALFSSEIMLPNVALFEPPNDILHWIQFNMDFNGFPNDDGILDNNDIEVLRTLSLDTNGGLDPFGIFDSQAEVDAFNRAIDAFLTYDFDISPDALAGTADLVLTITRDADGSEAGRLTLLGVSGEQLVDLFDNHLGG